MWPVILYCAVQGPRPAREVVVGESNRGRAGVAWVKRQHREDELACSHLLVKASSTEINLGGWWFEARLPVA